MSKKTVITAVNALLIHSLVMAANPASQEWVKLWVDATVPMVVNPASQEWVIAHFVPITSAAINWSALCPSGQSLTTTSGCAPDCNSGSAAPVCNKIFEVGQIEQLSGVPQPYLSNGVVIFQLTQTGGGVSASFKVTLQPTPDGYGYMCELLNANGTAATLWDVSQSTPFPSSVITMSASVSPDSSIDSDNFVSTLLQPVSGANYRWYTNANNPLYMMCLGYRVIDEVYLQSHAACGGSGDTCVTYSFQ